MQELSQEDREALAELCRLAEAGTLTDEDREVLRELAEAAQGDLAAMLSGDSGATSGKQDVLCFPVM